MAAMASTGMRLEVWTRLMGQEFGALREHAAAIDPGDVAAVARLRRSFDVELVIAALDLASARRKLARKWPDRAARLIADPSGAEMASSGAAATYKAGRLKAAIGDGTRVADLCCGIGGDAMSLAEAGLDVLAVDGEPVRAWMAGMNAACRTGACDVQAVELAGMAAVHIDPARREAASGASRRLWRLADLSPPVRVCAELVRRAGVGAVKLGPGVDTAELEMNGLLPRDSELEFISEGGQMTQAVVWAGLAQPNPRRATLIAGDGEAHSLCGEKPEGEDKESDHALSRDGLKAFLVEPDASIERAGLLHVACDRWGLTQWWPGLGLLTTDNAPIATPMLTYFRVVDRMPWIEKNVRVRLNALGAGVVEVKTRSRACDPDRVQRDLRGEGTESLTVFILRLGRSLEAVITRRVAQAGSS